METIKIEELEKIREIYEGFIYSGKHGKELFRLIGSEILLDSFFSDKRIILYIESIVKLFPDFDINDITDDIIKKNIYNNADCKYSVLLIKIPKEYDLESIKSEKFNLYHFDDQQRFRFSYGDEGFITDSKSEEDSWLERNELFIEFVDNLYGSDTGDKYYLEFINFEAEDELIQATAFGIFDNNLVQNRKEISSYLPIDRAGTEFDSNIATYSRGYFYFSYCPGYFGYNCWRRFCSKTPNNSFYFRASNLKDLIYVESMFIDRSINFTNNPFKEVYMDDLFDTLVVQSNVLINLHSAPFLFYPKNCLVLLTNPDTIDELRNEPVVTDLSSFQFNNKKLYNAINNIVNSNLDYFVNHKPESVILSSKYKDLKIKVDVDIYLDDSFNVELSINPIELQKFIKDENVENLVAFEGAYFSSLVKIVGPKNSKECFCTITPVFTYDFKFNNKVLSVINSDSSVDFSITKNIKNITCLDQLSLIRGRVLQQKSFGEYIRKDMKIFNQIINSSKAKCISLYSCFSDFDFTDNELILPDDKEYVFGEGLFKNTTITSSMLKSIVEKLNNYDISLEKGSLFGGSTVVGDDKIVIKKPTISEFEFSDMSGEGEVELILSEDVSKIEKRAFNGCSLIKNVKISPNTGIGDEAFKSSGVETVDLSEMDYHSGGYCFKECRNLVSVKLPNTIGCGCFGMFEHCHSIKKVTIPKGMTYIPGKMFNGCRNLSIVEFEGYVESFEEMSFSNCVNLKEFKNLKTSRLAEIGVRALSGCANLLINKEIKTPSLFIHEYAFFNCCSISSLSFNTSRGLYIAEGAFSQTGLEEINFSGGGKATFNAPFINTYFLKKVDININSDIGSLSFENCKSLEEVVLHKEKKYSFERNIFRDCPNLKSIHIPAGSLADYKPFFNYTMAGLDSIKVYVDLNNGESVHVNDFGAVYNKICEMFYDLFNNSSMNPESFKKILLNAINVYNSENSNFPVYNFIQIPKGKNVDPDEYDKSVINSLNIDRNNPMIISFKLLKSISENCSSLSIVVPVDSEYFYERFKEISLGLAKVNYLETLYYKNEDTFVVNINKDYSLLLVDLGFYSDSDSYYNYNNNDDGSGESGNFQTSIKCKNYIQPHGSDEPAFKYKKNFIEKYIKSDVVDDIVYIK